MAKWVGEGTPPYTGTIDCLTIYQLPDGKWYVRMKSSITGKRIKKDPVFEGFRKSSFRMKDASPIASKVYQQLPVKKYKLFREMTGKALLGLKAGLSVDIITELLIKEYIRIPVMKPVSKAPVIKRIPQQKLVALQTGTKIQRPRGATRYLRRTFPLSPPYQRPLYRALLSGALYQINDHQ